VSELLTGQQIMRELASRGLKVAATDGKPVLRGPSVEVTPALLRVLARRKDEVLALAGVAPGPPAIVVPAAEDIPRKPPREWLWRFGARYTEGPLNRCYGRAGCHPAGAWWWRYEGEPGWRVVPGRGGKGVLPPPGHMLSGLDPGVCVEPTPQRQTPDEKRPRGGRLFSEHS
jgi:hypothetical protein